MTYQELCDNPHCYIFRYILADYVEEYIGQGWEIVGMMQNTSIAINSVISYIMALEIQ